MTLLSEVEEDACLEATLVMILGYKEIILLLFILCSDLVTAFTESHLLFDGPGLKVKLILAV